MRRTILTAAIALGVTLFMALPAQAAFHLNDFEVAFTKQDGSPATQAGSHPFAMTTSFSLPYTGEGGEAIAEGKLRDAIFEQVAGLVGDATIVPRCSTAEFLADKGFGNVCPVESVVGIESVSLANVDFFETPTPVFSLPPPPGAALRLGWKVLDVPVVVDLGIKQSPKYNATATALGVNQTLSVFGSIVEIWGVPADPAHDVVRGQCARNAIVVDRKRFTRPLDTEECPTNANPAPFLTLPRSCPDPALSSYEARSWQEPDNWVAGSHSGPGLSGCGKLGFSPSIAAQPTSKAAQSPSGLDFSLDVADEGLANPSGLAQTDIRKAVVTLPEGFTANPSVAEGLEVCTEADLQAETLKALPGEGCPEAAKIGTVEVESQLIEETVKGSLFIAEPYENPFDSLLALYLVLKSPTLGILVKQPLEVVPDPVTGQLTTVAEDIPQLPFSHFRLHFREGTRSPLATPPTCGTHEVSAELTPWSGGDPVTTTSAFEIISGPNGGPCPAGGLPPFKPGLIAGMLNNRAGSFSPFNVRLFRSDSEQEFTRFSIKLPPGLSGKLAGIPFCPDAAIEAAKQKTGAQEELVPSCPAASEIGRSLAGAGVGPSLAYAPGKLYLAGPYNGSALSLVSITAAKVGPFDLGTVVVRFAFKIDRRTAEVFIDATGSDPIPHIIDGIQVHARDIRAYNDRPNFVLNPTSCERTSTASTVLGSGLDFASEADDNPVVVSTPFQAADCAALAFDPKLGLRLIGGTKRGAHPKFRATLTMKPGEANISYARVTLPRSAFLDQSHIRTVCTRVQYATNQCPPGSVYGYAKAITPLLDEPVEGPVYLRSSEHTLPDLVGALKNGKIEIDLVGRIDSLKGRIRNTFDIVPDAPVSTFTLTMQGGAKGLIVNSSDLCKGKQRRAIAEFDAHNGKAKDFRPQVRAKCSKGKRRP